MASSRTREARRVFMEVADLPTEKRAAALAEACGDDDALRAEVEALLDAEAQAGGLMPDPTADEIGAPPDSNPGGATVAAAPREQVGQMLGRYKLLEMIGEGGFGSVWAAEQKDPVKRRVALKIIKLGGSVAARVTRIMGAKVSDWKRH